MANIEVTDEQKDVLRADGWLDPSAASQMREANAILHREGKDIYAQLTAARTLLKPWDDSGTHFTWPLDIVLKETIDTFKDEVAKLQTILATAKQRAESAEASLREVTTELSAVDMAIGNASVFDKCKTRYEKIRLAIDTASTTEGMLRDLREVTAERDAAWKKYNDALIQSVT